MNKTDFYATNINGDNSINNTIKRIVTFVMAIIFVLGCMWVPGSEFVEEGHAASSSLKYAEGEVIVGYIDIGDMDLTAKQEKKADNLLGDGEELAIIEEVAIEDVDVDESKLDESIQDKEVVDETLTLVSSESKSTEELIGEIEKLPNVDFVEPNYLNELFEEEPVAPLTEEAVSEESEAQEEVVQEEETAPTEENAVTEEEQTSEEDADDDVLTEELQGEDPEDGDYTDLQWAYYNEEGYSSSYRLFIDKWDEAGASPNAEGTVVAVLDTGVDYGHPDLDDVMWDKGLDYGILKSASSEYGGHSGGTYGINVSRSGNEGDPMDDHGHGTHCAGIIAAEWGNGGVAGAANGAKIMAIRAGDSGGLYDSDILYGYNYIMNAIDCGVNVVAVNNSWGKLTTGASALDRIVEQAGKKGLVSVFASGNSAINNDVKHTFSVGGKSYEGTFTSAFLKDNPYKIAVDNVDCDGSLAGTSNYGKTTTDVGAPGQDILSTVVRGFKIKGVPVTVPYVYMNGTSMAAPAVAGEVAILSARCPDYPADVIASMVINNTTSDTYLSGKCKSGGTANVQKALASDPKNFKYRHFKLSGTSFTYDGKKKMPTVSELNLVEDQDYTVTYPSDVTTVGKHTISVTGIGEYAGRSTSLTYTINKFTPKMSLKSGAYYYDGATKTNTEYVTGVGGAKWARNNQYTVAGLSAKIPGTYKVTAKPKDTKNYNAISKTYKIVVKPTGISSLSRLKKGFKVRAGKQAKKYVNGYQVRYSHYKNMKGAASRTIGTKYNRTTKKITKLKKNNVYYVQVRTYKTINKKNYYSAWSAVKAVKTK